MARDWLRRFTLLILSLIAFGALVVGISLGLGVLAMGDLPGASPRDLLVPLLFVAYGTASAVAYLAERRRAGWALPVVLLSQVSWALGMLWAWATIAPDWSLLVAAGLAVAPSVTAVLSRVTPARRA